MTLYSTLARVAADWRYARSEARTRRIIASLPAEVRKDIGWPDALEGDARRNTSRSRTH
jgi:Tfp pilus assembly protein FimT